MLDVRRIKDCKMLIPFFKSHHSIGKSILTLEKPSGIKNAPRSIVEIAKENNLNKIFLIEDSFGGFMKAEKNLSAEGIKYTFGVRITCVTDIAKKDEDSLKDEHKIVLLPLNNKGLISTQKLYSKAATEGFYYIPRIDYKSINEILGDDVKLIVPFYDSYIFNNTLKIRRIVPDFKVDPIFAWESNGLPFDRIIQGKISDKNTIKGKSIYYENRDDFEAYLTNRCLHERTTLEKPELEHMHSNEFCFESWLEFSK